MPPEGDYLFTNTGYSNDQPVLSLSLEDTFYDFSPIGQTFTLTGSFEDRHCTGWRDITNGIRSACPSRQVVDSKYDQCSACQQRTGFNPAFYHASTVSPQQEARNQQPHILYLAYFGGDIIKVGISHAARGNNRLLEQGARAAIILETFPTAHIARQYEAKIAGLPGIAETVAVRQKLNSLTLRYDSSRISSAVALIESTLGVTFDSSEIATFDHIYFPRIKPDLADIILPANQQTVSGSTIGVLGSILLTQQQEATLGFPLKKLIGRTVNLSYSEATIELPPRQMGLF